MADITTSYTYDESLLPYLEDPSRRLGSFLTTYSNPYLESGPMSLPHQKIYTSIIRNRPVSSILYFRAGVTGTIREVAIYPGGSTTFGDWYFNVRLNGDPLFSGSNRPKVNGANPIIKSGLNVPCTQGDTIVLDLEQAGSGSIPGPTTFIVTIESAG